MPKMDKSKKLLTPSLIDSILQDRGDRMQELLEVGRFEDAVCIGEEFDEWITDMMI
jgi:hypothetical protein|tara:strand:+ start:300 stop:467 length:168 start_codon:yes stop_codon:yes gene_type:complete